MPNQKKLLQLPDEELIALIKKEPDYISVVYKKTKDYCLRFLYKKSAGSGVKEDELEEIFHKAVITLYEKIINENFQLTNNASIQTYLNSVCRYQLLDKFKKVNKGSSLEDAEPNLKELQVDPAIEDELRQLKIQDEKQYTALLGALEKMESAGGLCYEILTLFWYHGKSMAEIAGQLGYANAETTKQQKARCQKRLRQMAHRELMTDQ